MIWAVIWYYLLAVFTAADVITTKIALANGAKEVNPFMAGLTDHIVEVKFVFLILVIIMVAFMESRSKDSSWPPVAGGACVTFVAVVSNIIQIAGLV
jgi:hypothetical protein